jgi:hypothetical protein
MKSRSAPFVWFLLGIGGVTICWAAYNLWFGAASKAWPSVPGVVEASKVTWCGTTKNSIHTEFTAIIRYRYTVHNQMLTGSRISYGDSISTSRSEAHAIVGRYPPERPVTVYYQPGNPARCVLEPGMQLGNWIFFLFGAVFFTAGLLLIWATRPKEWESHYGW